MSYKKQKIKILPGLLSILILVFDVLGLLMFVPLVLFSDVPTDWVDLILYISYTLFFKIYFLFYKHGFELFIILKDNQLYVFRDFFINKKYTLTSDIKVYKSKISTSGFSRGEGPFTCWIDEEGDDNAFIIIFNDDFIGEEFAKKSNGGFSLTNRSNKLKYLGNLLKNKKIVPLMGSKGNYKFLRQYLKYEQFCGMTEQDIKDLEKYELSYQKKMAKYN